MEARRRLRRSRAVEAEALTAVGDGGGEKSAEDEEDGWDKEGEEGDDEERERDKEDMVRAGSVVVRTI